ncbi:MAG: hypothetical protein K5793_01795 [Nitrosarchaeum sp.]|nr:hypothetical protein [Nitrosarchaeum sp.]MCV0400018.1 hypothetical protein [Nitrosarchaeum sp.]
MIKYSVFFLIFVGIGFLPVNAQSLQDISESGIVFEIQPQQPAEFASEHLTVMFLEVLEDSRCPSDVTCVWEGQIRLAFEIFQDSTDKIILNNNDTVTAMYQDSSIEIVLINNESVSVFDKYQIQLIDVKPYPNNTLTINPSDYAAVLKISKNSSDVIPPLKQMMSGIYPENVMCKAHLILVAKYDGSPACVTQKTKTNLIERGWTNHENAENTLPEKEPHPTLSDFRNVLLTSPDIDKIFDMFSQPDADIGSGIHIYVYNLNDSTQIWIGYSDSILYIRHIDEKGNLLEELF